MNTAKSREFTLAQSMIGGLLGLGLSAGPLKFAPACAHAAVAGQDMTYSVHVLYIQYGTVLHSMCSNCMYVDSDIHVVMYMYKYIHVHSGQGAWLCSS